MQSTKPFRCKAIREVRAALPQRYPPTSLYDSEISRGVPSKAFSTNRSKARRWFHVSLTIPATVYLGEGCTAVVGQSDARIVAVLALCWDDFN